MRDWKKMIIDRKTIELELVMRSNLSDMERRILNVSTDDRKLELLDLWIAHAEIDFALQQGAL